MACPEGQALPKLVQTKVSFLRAASERGMHLLRSPSAPEAAALWPSDEKCARSRDAQRPRVQGAAPGTRPTAGF